MPAARQSPAVLTVSEYSKTKIMEWANIPAERVHVVGNGVSEGFLPDGPAANLGFPYLLYVGNYKPHKNIPRMFAAFARTRASSDTRLCIVGKEDKSLLVLAKSLNISDRIRFLGSKTNEQLAGLYRGAQALICASTEEGFGLPVLEAMACGTPALVGEGHAAEEVANGAAIKCNPFDVDAIANAIDQIIDNSSLRLDLIEKGLKRSNDFSWDHVAARVAHAINSVQ